MEKWWRQEDLKRTVAGWFKVVSENLVSDINQPKAHFTRSAAHLKLACSVFPLRMFLRGEFILHIDLEENLQYKY